MARRIGTWLLALMLLGSLPALNILSQTVWKKHPAPCLADPSTGECDPAP